VGDTTGAFRDSAELAPEAAAAAAYLCGIGAGTVSETDFGGIVGFGGSAVEDFGPTIFAAVVVGFISNACQYLGLNSNEDILYLVLMVMMNFSLFPLKET
jgi:hypothetical protein